MLSVVEAEVSASAEVDGDVSVAVVEELFDAVEAPTKRHWYEYSDRKTNYTFYDAEVVAASYGAMTDLANESQLERD